MTKITQAMIERRRQELLSTKSQLTVNQSFCILRALLNFAQLNFASSLGAPMLSENPVKKVSRHEEQAYRQTFIADADLPAWHAALQEVQWQTVRDYMLFVLLSGLRMREAMKLRWSDVDLERGIINMPSDVCKNNKGYALALSQALLQLLKQRKLQASSL